MIASSFIKSAAVAAVVALASPAFSATVIPMTSTKTGSTGGFTMTHTDGTDPSLAFTDNYVFSIGSSIGVVGASAIEIILKGSTTDYLTLNSLSLNGKSVLFKTGTDVDGNTTYSATVSTASINDPQTLAITGNVVGGGGSYGGNVTFTAAAVPEAATWGMMLVGFGAMGGALRSNRRRAGALTA